MIERNENGFAHVFFYTIREQEDGITVEGVLKKQGYSQKLISHLRQYPDGLSVDGTQIYTTKHLSKGRILRVCLREQGSSEKIAAVNLPFPVVYEDEHLIVVNKPAHMSIHPSQGHHEDTLANAAAWYFAEKNEPFVYRAINRLDRDTTGLLILAKHGLSGAILSQMSARREIHRTYLAVCEGKVPEHGTVAAPIARVEASTVERCVDMLKGENAVTHFSRLGYQNGYSLVELQLETGRTHQIRVHMKHLGYPLAGDFLYNWKEEDVIGRQALHSWKLQFSHPITGEEMYFESRMPEDMKKIVACVAEPLLN